MPDKIPDGQTDKEATICFPPLGSMKMHIKSTKRHIINTILIEKCTTTLHWKYVEITSLYSIMIFPFLGCIVLNFTIFYNTNPIYTHYYHTCKLHILTKYLITPKIFIHAKNEKRTFLGHRFSQICKTHELLTAKEEKAHQHFRLHEIFK